MIQTDSTADSSWKDYLLADIWNAFEMIFGYLTFDMYPGSKRPVVVNPILCGSWVDLHLEAQQNQDHKMLHSAEHCHSGGHSGHSRSQQGTQRHAC